MSLRRLLLVSAALFLPAASPDGTPLPAGALLPDLITVIPGQIQVVNPGKDGKTELLRFSNAIANLGDGPWHMRPEFPLNTLDPQKAIQELYDASGSKVAEKVVSQFEFHPTHNHWHINGVALFEVRASRGGRTGGADIGAVYGRNSIKTTFCLIDWIRYEGNSNNGKKSDRVYFDCMGATQGISVGWVDQYHQATDGQELDITGAPVGRYYLVSTANYDKVFLEKSTENNRAWVAFDLSRDSNGNAKIALAGDSLPEGEGLPMAYSPNR